MQSFLLIGFNFFKFWFYEAPLGMVMYFVSLNEAFLKLFSFRVLVSTYFKPWKNEYRQGLVGFSILMGMVIKSVVIFFTLLGLLVITTIEVVLIVAFVLWPIATIAIVLIP